MEVFTRTKLEGYGLRYGFQQTSGTHVCVLKGTHVCGAPHVRDQGVYLDRDEESEVAVEIISKIAASDAPSAVHQGDAPFQSAPPAPDSALKDYLASLLMGSAADEDEDDGRGGSVVMGRGLNTTRSQVARRRSSMLDAMADFEKSIRGRVILYVTATQPGMVWSSPTAVPEDDSAVMLCRKAQTAAAQSGSLPQLAHSANLPSVIMLLESPEHLFVVHELERYTLDSLCRARPVPHVHGLSDMKRRYLFYQLLHALECLHSADICHGSLSSQSVGVSSSLWLVLMGGGNNFTQPSLPASLTPTAFSQWMSGNLSNLEYILYLNHCCGRRVNNPTFHPCVPWVTDFSGCPEGQLRDLSKTKFRLSRGDEQLDFTYASTDPAHHVSNEPISELTFFTYFARRRPVCELQRVVRPNFEPNEYPVSMQRLFDWTPDECVPEFYTDPEIFISLHKDAGLSDLLLPDWAADGQDFVTKHRQVFESPQVSACLHQWIDLFFGCCMAGPAAIAAKNVVLADRSRLGGVGAGFVQLFTCSHPVRGTAVDTWEALQLEDNGGHAGSTQTSSIELETILLGSSPTVPPLPQHGSNKDGRSRSILPSFLAGPKKPSAVQANSGAASLSSLATATGLTSIHEGGSSTNAEWSITPAIGQEELWSVGQGGTKLHGDKALVSDVGNVVKFRDQEDQQKLSCQLLSTLTPCERFDLVPSKTSDLAAAAILFAELYLAEPLTRSPDHGLPNLSNTSGLPTAVKDMLLKVVSSAENGQREIRAGDLLFDESLFPLSFAPLHRFQVHLNSCCHTWSDQLQACISELPSLFATLPVETHPMLYPIAAVYLCPTVSMASDTDASLRGVAAVQSGLFLSIAAHLQRREVIEFLFPNVLKLFSRAQHDIPLLASLLAPTYIFGVLDSVGLEPFVANVLPFILEAVILDNNDTDSNSGGDCGAGGVINIHEVAVEVLCQVSQHIARACIIRAMIAPLLEYVSQGDAQACSAVARLCVPIGESSVIQHVWPFIKAGETGLESLVGLDARDMASGTVPSRSLGCCMLLAKVLAASAISPATASAEVGPIVCKLLRNAIQCCRHPKLFAAVLSAAGAGVHAFGEDFCAGQLMPAAQSFLSDCANQVLTTSDDIDEQLDSIAELLFVPLHQIDKLYAQDVLLHQIPLADRLVERCQRAAKSSDELQSGSPDHVHRQAADDLQAESIINSAAWIVMGGDVRDYTDEPAAEPELNFSFSFRGHQTRIATIDCNSMESLLLTGAKDSIIRVWSVSPTLLAQTTYQQHTEGHINFLKFVNKDSKVLSCDGTLHCWDSATGGQVSVVEDMDPILKVAYMPSRGACSAVTASARPELRFCSMTDAWKSSAMTMSWRLKFSPKCIETGVGGVSGSWLAVGGAAGQISLIDDRTAMCGMSWTAHDGAGIVALHALPGNRLVSTTQRSMAVWDIAGARPVLEQELMCQGMNEDVTATICAGDTLVAACGSKMVAKSMRCTELGQRVVVNPRFLNNESKGKYVAARCLTWLPVSRLICAGLEDGRVKIAEVKQ